MPCQTFSRLWAVRQPLQPHSMKHLSLYGRKLPLWSGYRPSDSSEVTLIHAPVCELNVYSLSVPCQRWDLCLWRGGGGWLTPLLWFPWFTRINNADLQTQTLIKLHIRFNFLQTLVCSTANRDDVKWYRQRYGCVYIIKLRSLLYSHLIAVLPWNPQCSHTNPTLQNNLGSCVQLH